MKRILLITALVAGSTILAENHYYRNNDSYGSEDTNRYTQQYTGAPYNRQNQSRYSSTNQPIDSTAQQAYDSSAVTDTTYGRDTTQPRSSDRYTSIDQDRSYQTTNEQETDAKKKEGPIKRAIAAPFRAVKSIFS